MLIALGVSGGIAAYKAPEIVRGLYKAGAEVQVMMTEHAGHFVTPFTLQTLSGRNVLLDPWGLDQDATVAHIELSRSIDALVVAPATANSIAKFANGIADDFLSTFYVSVTAPVVVAPAMNTRMWLHATTQRNVARLADRGVRIVQPESGWLAERESGVGRMAEPETIVAAALTVARRSRQLAGKKIVVSAGPTRERIDPVRFVSNRSSGKMGYALAEVLARRGAAVTLVSGPVALATPFGVARVAVETAGEMRRAVLEALEGADALFMAAAVGDYAPRARDHKIKKTEEMLTLQLDRGPDILREVGERSGGAILVGFAAETESLLDNARAKLERKKLDFIVANDVSQPEVGFESDENAVTILSAAGKTWDVPRAGKTQVAEAIADAVFGEASDG